MKSANSLSIIGSGPTAIYFIKHILDNASVIYSEINDITIFEKRDVMGMGMPYNPETTDKYNLANISSNEIPELPESFGNWLRLQNKDSLKKWNITEFPIDDSKVYSRLALGQYFHEQYKLLVSKLKHFGFNVTELAGHDVTDIKVNKAEKMVQVIVDCSKSYTFSKVIIAVGHNWIDKDQPEKGYYASPWPIKKLDLKKNEYHNYKIGILGASLSAFDVVTYLAHLNGKFVQTQNGLDYLLNEESNGFKIILHSLEGWLPHLQYEQEKPIREIYRHANREEILSLVNKNGFLYIDVYFDKICRPALVNAFEKDKDFEVVNVIAESSFKFNDFIELMSHKHEYIDSFVGMRKEMVSAQDSVKNHKPIHWMETFDDLMYCLNFHAELLPAEDYLTFRKDIMPFLMSVIAAFPIRSAEILLALYDAGCIEIVSGEVEILDNAKKQNETLIKIKGSDGKEITSDFKMFIDCGGQENIELKNYPFRSMVKLGTVRKARAKFTKMPTPEDLEIINDDKIFYAGEEAFLYTGGIDVDTTYRVIGEDGSIEPKIFDLTFPHIFGRRPYSYGLQACNATSLIVVSSLVDLDETTLNTKLSIETITKLYKEEENL